MNKNRFSKISLTLVLTMFYSINLLAQETTQRPPVSGLPFPIDEKKRLSEVDVAKKKEGWFVTGIGGPFSDPNNGAGFGGRIFLFNNGKKDDPFFQYTPYRQRFFLNLSTTTKNAIYHQLDWDAPFLGNTTYRARGSAILDSNPNLLFFGLGESSLKGLGYYPRNDVSQPYVNTGRFNDQQAAQEYRRSARGDEPYYPDLANGKSSFNSYLLQNNPNLRNQPVTDKKYNRYELTTPQVNFSIEKSFLGGLIRTVAGTRLSNNIVKTYDGTVQKANDNFWDSTPLEFANINNIPTVQGKTKLTEDFERGKIQGIKGGYVNLVRLGLVYDSRDFEPDPGKGIFAEVTHERSHKAAGSNFEFNRTFASARVYYTILPKVFKKLVFAGRVAFVHNSGNLPFFEYRNMWSTEGNLAGLGGRTTLRGFIQDRFVGNEMGFANLELRWRFLEVPGFTFNIAPMFDMGRVWDSLSRVKANAWDGYKYSSGLGLRIIWNQSTVIYLEWARSRETGVSEWGAAKPFLQTNFYLNFGHIF
jgi:hypothetical protein